MTHHDRPRALIVAYSLQPPGGGRAVGAWCIQALLPDYEITLATGTDLNIEAVNQAFGTQLPHGGFEHHNLMSAFRWLERLPLSLSQLKLHLMMRRSRQLAARHDVVISFDNEAWFGCRSIQYIHYPWAQWLRPQQDYHWYHFEVLRRLYDRTVRRLSGFNETDVAHNLSLCNSAYIAQLVRNLYHNRPEVLNPPALGNFQRQPWQERTDRFVALGRISPEKRLIEIIDILQQVRQMGFPLQLDIVGHRDHPEDLIRLKERMKSAGDWVRMHIDVPRTTIDQMLTQGRYGIHAMHGEHYGMAVAEMVVAGRIPFVHNSGGQVEIVEHQPELCFDDIPDAVQKIVAVLSNPDLQHSLLSNLEEVRDRISSTAFCAGLQEHVSYFLD